MSDEIPKAPSRVSSLPNGLLLAAIALIGPILWDVYKNSTELTLEHLVTTTLIGQEQLPERLVVTYDGQPTSQLSTLVFALTNSGNTVIRAADVVQYPALEVKGPARLLAAELDHVSPPGVIANIETESISTGKVSVTFPVLNPGDRIRFSVLVSSLLPQYAASARIAGVRQLKIVEPQKPRETAKGLADVRWPVYLVAAVTFFLFRMVIFLVSMLGRSQELKVLWERNLIQFPEGITPSELEHLVGGIVQPHEPIATPFRIPALAHLPQGEPIPKEYLAQANRYVGDFVARSGDGQFRIAYFSVLTAIGVIYVTSSLVGALL
jgi:hypothetical protein